MPYACEADGCTRANTTTCCQLLLAMMPGRGLTYSAARLLSTTACTGLIDEPSVMSTKRTLELLRTDLTQPQSWTSETRRPGCHSFRSATVLTSRRPCPSSPGMRTE
jgi:hypothetical protein